MDSFTWAIVGGAIGAFWSIYVTAVVTGLSVLMAPGDPSAGSVGIVIIGLLPLGIIAGILSGGIIWNKKSQAVVAEIQPVNGHGRIAVAILAISLGAFGIHKFKLGYKKQGMIMVLFTILTFCSGGLITGIIGLMEGVVYLKMTNSEFYEIYVNQRRGWF